MGAIPVSTTATKITNITNFLSPTLCGVSGRIVGGAEVGMGVWPWVVSILSSNGVPFCAGSLVSHRHVLTAAHCITGENQTMRFPLWVAVGEHRNHNLHQNRTRTVGVTHALYHANFSTHAKFDSDISVLVLTKQFDPELRIIPACLPNPGYTVAGSVAKVLGWGATKESGSISQVLQEVEIPILPPQPCKKSYPITYLEEKMICAGHLKGGVDACQGDSGGPLTHQQHPDAPWTVVGVVSFGRGCGRPASPGVYTKITTFLPWLTEVMTLYP
ncbi:trypsin-1-like [Homarus americanus]|uniref:trypsin-1-like n=1 Tax=Homarus americanus TaxID=6706 RepID=UPI001C481AAE|nr:trypsin-1-like [Homarus americanus]